MFQAVKRWISRGRIHIDPQQLGLPLDGPRPPLDAPRARVRRSPRPSPGSDEAAALLARLRDRGLKSISAISLTKNSRVMVSFRGGEMRVHRGYVDAGPEVLDAIVRLVEGRTRTIRRTAGKFIVAHSPVDQTDEPRRRERTHPDDADWSRRLVLEHARLNAAHFSSALSTIDVRVSRRMKSRLGHYSPAVGDTPAEIAISRRHIRRHGWDDALETLLHEMVHQWQAETGAPLDHGPGFRRKAREVGIRPRAVRKL